MQTKVDIINALDTLNPEQLNKVAIYVTDIRRAGWGVGPPPAGERPAELPLGPCATWTADRPPVSFLPNCRFQYRDGKVVKCNKDGNERYLGPCSKRCKAPDKPPTGIDLPYAPFDSSSGKRPLKEESPENSAGIGGECGNCGIEKKPLYAFTTVSEEQTIDVCAECFTQLRQKG